MNSYTNDPLSRMTSQEIDEAQVHLRCDFCSALVPEDTMERIDGYKLCSECYDQYCSEPDIED